jgi:hypothetical protein
MHPTICTLKGDAYLDLVAVHALHLEIIANSGGTAKSNTLFSLSRNQPV